MKRPLLVIILFAAVLFSSCGKKISETGTIEVKNGEGDLVELPYRVVPAEAIDFLSKQYTYKQFDSIVSEVSSKSKLACNVSLSYKPKELSILQKNDTSTFMLTFYAKNSYGVEDSEILMYDVIKGEPMHQY